jgi:hypothetical protein
LSLLLLVVNIVHSLYILPDFPDLATNNSQPYPVFPVTYSPTKTIKLSPYRKVPEGNLGEKFVKAGDFFGEGRRHTSLSDLVSSMMKNEIDALNLRKQGNVMKRYSLIFIGK